MYFGVIDLNDVLRMEEMYQDKEVEKCLLDNYKLLEQGILPKSYINKPLPQYLGSPFTGKYIDIRNKYINKFGFPLFAENWVKPLAKWIGNRPCLEIMAGSGYLSYALNKYGVNIKATDNYSWQKKLDMTQKYYRVENMDAVEAVLKYGKDVKFVICSWPYMDNTAFRALMAMERVNFNCRMIYIGEGYAGCTADDNFFEYQEVCNVEGFNKAVSAYRSWTGVHDYPELCKTKITKEEWDKMQKDLKKDNLV